MTVSNRYDDLMELLNARQRRRFNRGLKRKHMALLKKVMAAKANCEEGERPEIVRTHLRNMIIVPEMIGSVVGVYNGHSFVQVEIKVCSRGPLSRPHRPAPAGPAPTARIWPPGSVGRGACGLSARAGAPRARLKLTPLPPAPRLTPARHDRPLPRRVLPVVQARRPRPPGHWRVGLVPLHPPQVRRCC